MIDHISVAVRDLERAARFYEAALAPLGLTRLVTRPATIGFGKAYSEFWINLRVSMSPVEEGSGAHIALRAKTTGDVDAFHAAALSAGGRSDGRRASVRTIASNTMRHSSSIPTATASRP